MRDVKRRGKIYYCWVPRPAGGVRLVSTNCTDKDAARLRARELERRAVDPRHAAEATQTTRDLLTSYVASRRRLGRSEGTMHHVTVKAGHLARLLPARAADVTHEEMEKYIDARVAEGTARTTVKKELRVLGAAWKLARRNRRVAAGVDEIMPEMSDDYTPRTRALSPWELVGLATVLPRHRAAHVAFIVATGARWSESVRAELADVDEETWLVHLRGTKTAGALRDVPIPGHLRRVLMWAARNVSRDVKLENVNLLFVRWENVNRDLRAACDALGIAPVTPNDLRRTFGTWLRAAGVEPQLIGAAMGHRDSRMVEKVYGRLTPDALGKLLAERTQPVRLMSSTGGTQAPSVAVAGTKEAAITAENTCPETESNRRHGDFQSSNAFRGPLYDTEYQAARAAYATAVVRTCPVSVPRPKPFPLAEATANLLGARVAKLEGDDGAGDLFRALQRLQAHVPSNHLTDEALAQADRAIARARRAGIAVAS